MNRGRRRWWNRGKPLWCHTSHQDCQTSCRTALRCDLYTPSSQLATPPQSQTCQSTHSAAISASHASPLADTLGSEPDGSHWTRRLALSHTELGSTHWATQSQTAHTLICNELAPQWGSHPRHVPPLSSLGSVEATPPQSQTCQLTHSAAISASHASPVADTLGSVESHASPVADLSINTHRCDQRKPRLPRPVNQQTPLRSVQATPPQSPTQHVEMLSS